ncbi:34074_t:CDS:2, partial [Racocetra persica]
MRLVMDAASAASKYRKHQNNDNTSSGGNCPDFAIQSCSGYELFSLEVAGPSHKDQTKFSNDSIKLDRLMQNSLNYIFSKELELGCPAPKKLQIFGASTKKYEITFKKLIRVGKYVILKRMFIAEIPTTIADYSKLRDLIKKMIILC